MTMNIEQDPNQEQMPLNEFLKLPNTVAFTSYLNPTVEQYIADKPYIYVGTQFLATNDTIFYTSEQYMDGIFADLGYTFNIFPQVYGLMGEESLDDTGISWVQQQPFLDLRGSGVILGFVDTGIDYTSEAFKYEDGTSKIKYIWDQTLEGTVPSLMQFGATYTQEQINEALASDNPYEVVPHRDTVGHGTFLASVAGGRGTGAAAGAAPDAEIVAVKLKKASPYYIEKYLIPHDQDNAFESTDIMMGIKFIYDYATSTGRPAVICLGVGTNFGGHAGNSKFEKYISALSGHTGTAFCTAAGNEGTARHHTQGRIATSDVTEDIDVRVGLGAKSFSVIISYEGYDTISASIQSPTGETTGRIPYSVGTSFYKKFLLENATAVIHYQQDVNRFIIIQIRDITPGIWKITLHGTVVVSGIYNAWLPITGLVHPDIEFANPYPDCTITIPATDYGSLCCGAYNGNDGSLYLNNSWGPTATPRIAPDFALPGVDVAGIYPYGEGVMSGTSVAAALASGACALLFQWGIVQRNEIAMNGYRLRTLLIRGCTRDNNLTYPNNLWGYGKLDLEKTFRVMREE